MGRPTLEERAKKPAAAALAHPLRVRILGVLTQRDMSPSQFVEEDLAKGYFDGNRSLSQVSYHFRELALAGCLEIVETIPVRGAVEHVYRGTARAFHSTTEWEKLSLEQRRAITKTTWQAVIAQVETSIINGSFDSLSDRHLAWLPVTVDPQGWKELGELYDATLARAEEINAAAAQRAAQGGGTEFFEAAVAQLAFATEPLA